MSKKKETNRYNCLENDNYLIFNKYLKAKDNYAVDEIYVGVEGEKGQAVIGYNDLLDSLLIAVGWDDLMADLVERQNHHETDRASKS